MRPVMFTGASKAVGRSLKPLTPTVLCERTGWLSSSEFTYNYTSLRDRPTRDARISYDKPVAITAIYPSKQGMSDLGYTLTQVSIRQ